MFIECRIVYRQYASDKHIYSCSFFLRFKRSVSEIYNPLFKEKRSEEDGEEPSDSYTAYLKKWNWWSVLWYLSKEDLTKFDDVLDLPVLTVLNQLSYKKETDHFIDQARKKQNQQNKM